MTENISKKRKNDKSSFIDDYIEFNFINTMSKNFNSDTLLNLESNNINKINASKKIEKSIRNNIAEIEFFDKEIGARICKDIEDKSYDSAFNNFLFEFKTSNNIDNIFTSEQAGRSGNA